jgi:outer membrane protein OmpA-like peptidoglycan-associated protein
MDNYNISECEEFEYDSAEFYDAQDNEYVIEGHKWIISYTLQEGFNPPGQLKVRQNYINAVKEIGGEILYEQGVCMKIVKAGKETWVDLWVSDDGSDYRLTIVEKTAMEQEVVADPEAMALDIIQKGAAVVYGIYFDLDSSTIKPESAPTLKAIADMLEANPSMDVYVVGHTDMTGEFGYNMDLSLRRARAVVNELESVYGISSNRMEARGVGPLCPVSSNKFEEGKKLNRRVELVGK